MVKHYCLTAILVFTVSTSIQALNNPPLVSQQLAQQAQVPAPQDKESADGQANKADKKGEAQKKQTVKNTKKQQDTFTPTEEISEDLAVSFPVDI